MRDSVLEGKLIQSAVQASQHKANKWLARKIFFIYKVDLVIKNCFIGTKTKLAAKVQIKNETTKYLLMPKAPKKQEKPCETQHFSRRMHKILIRIQAK